MGKTYAGTYLYRQYGEYESQIFNFMMTATEIDKDIDEFSNIKYEVKKRQVSNALIKVLESKEVILLTGEKPLSKAFKVFCAKDIKGPKKDKMKVFIDCSNIIVKDSVSGKYVCNRTNIDIFISYLVSAMHTLIYYIDETMLVSNAKIMQVGAQAFSSLFTHIIDYVCKISTIPSLKCKCLYLSSMYYMSNLLGKDSNSEGCKKISKKISGLSDRDAEIINIQLTQDSFTNIKYFVDTLADILKINKLTLDIVVEKWMSIYGTGTVFSLEMFPAFASMLTDVYVGAYINNQKTIEKVAGQSMTEFTKVILTIGAEVV